MVSKDGTDMKPSKLKVEGETKKEKEFQHDELSQFQTKHTNSALNCYDTDLYTNI